MSDDLRTRIAAAIRAVDDMRVCKLSDADIKFITDAVIRELRLRIQVAGPDGIIGTGKYRYVSDFFPADIKKPYGCQRCDCSCCYGYEDCHCVTDPCNCGSTKREHGR